MALGWRNYLLVGTEAGSCAAAIVDTLARLPDHKITRIEELLPRR